MLCLITEFVFFFFFKQKTAYEIYQCDWSSDVCSSDLALGLESMMATYFGGDMEAGVAMSGQVQGRINSIEPVADILSSAWADCQMILAELGARTADSN